MPFGLLLQRHLGNYAQVRFHTRLKEKWTDGIDFAHQKTDLLKQKAVSATAGNTGCIKRIHFLKAAS